MYDETNVSISNLKLNIEYVYIFVIVLNIGVYFATYIFLSTLLLIFLRSSKYDTLTPP